MRRPEQILQQNAVKFLRQALPPPPAGPVWFAPDPGVFASGEHARKIGGIRKSMGVRSGIPDLVFIWRTPFAIEFKAPNGAPSGVQKEVMAELATMGANTYIARRLEDVQIALEAEGVPLNARVM